MRMKDKQTIFQQILDVCLPALVYYLASSIFLYVLNLIVQGICSAQGESGLIFIFNHAAEINATNNGIAMLIGAMLILRHFLKETVYHGQELVIKVRKAVVPGVREGLRKCKALKLQILWPVGLAVTSSICLNLAMGLITDVTGLGNYAHVAAAQYAVSPLLAVVLYGVISPIAEEMMYRGVLLGKLARYLNPTVAILASSLLFGLFHGNLVQGIYAFAMGLFIGYVYVRYNAFGVPVLFHAVANLVIYFLTLFGIPGENFVLKMVMLGVSAILSVLFIVRIHKSVV